MMGRNQKMGSFEEDIILYYGDNEEPLKYVKQKRNIGVTCYKASVWRID